MDAAPSPVAPTPPLSADDAPGWEPLAAALGAVHELPDAANGRTADLGAGLLGAMQAAFALQRSLAHGDLPAASAERIAPAELLDSSVLGEESGRLQLPLYERVMAAQRAGSLSFLRALAQSDGGADGAEAAAAGAPSHEIAARLGVHDDSSSDDDDGDDGARAPATSAADAAAAAADAAAFRELYLGIVTEACGEELDGIRRDEQLDPRGLASLIDALEFGAETFDATDASLALRSFAPAAATAEADDDEENAGEDDDDAAAGGPPPLLRAARELRKSTRAARRAS